MEEGSVTVLVDAKEEYTKQLISILKACIYQGIKSIYMDAKDICNQDNSPDNVLMVFQDLLSRIPKWSQDIINKEFERIANISKCDYIDDLLKVVYVSHIKILTIVHSAQKNKKISLKVPSGSHFIHLCYIECAREFWKDPYYFSDRVTKYENQKNMRDSETMIAECIMETIRKQLPVRHILKEFLNDPDEDIEEEDEDIKDPSKKKYLKKLETVVKKELKSTSKTGDISEINIELIRKVIREEMNSRPDTDKIKKELVDTVVEKIVEKTQEGLTDTDTVIVDVPIIPVVPIIPIVSVSVMDINTDTEKKEVASLMIPESSKEKEIVKDSSLGIKKQTNSLENLLNETQDDNEDEIDVDLEDINMNIDSDINNLVTNTIKEKEVYKEKPNEKTSNEKIANEKTANIQSLVINNIDEINLNLDELDNDMDIDTNLNNDLEAQSDNEIDLDEMQSVDLTKPTKASTPDKKSDPNTKYIFFKDVE